MNYEIRCSAKFGLASETPGNKIVDRWSCDDVQVNDMSLQDYIAVKEKNAKYLPHFLMMHGRNNRKKLMSARVFKQAFEIIHLLTTENLLPMLVTAILNYGPFFGLFVGSTKRFGYYVLTNA